LATCLADLSMRHLLRIGNICTRARSLHADLGPTR
jgi:hypothetical protein